MTVFEYKKSVCLPNNIEITKAVQKYFKAPEAFPTVPNKTWTKTKKCMIKERPDDMWEKHYVRRKENDSKGYQSAIGEMYKALGDEVVLNTCDLVLKTMSNCLDPEIKKQALFRHQEDRAKHEKKHAITLPPISHTTVPKQPAAKEEGISKTDTPAIELPEVHSFHEIKQYLDESKSVIRRVHCGLPYVEYVRKRQENINRSKQEQENTKENEMVLMSLTNLQLGLPDMHTLEEEEEIRDEVKESPVIRGKGHGSPRKIRRKSVMIDPYTNRRLSVDPLTRSLMKKELVPGRMTLVSPVIEGPNQLIGIPSGITAKKDRLRKDHLHYLQALSMILTSINNMKTRELKSRTPLKLDAVKALRKEPVVEAKIPFVKESKQATHLLRHQSRSQQPSALQRMASSSGRGLLEQVAGITGLTSKLKKKSLWGAIGKPQQKPQHQGPVVETWEDLINLEEPQKTNDLTLQSKILMKALLWSRRKAITPHVDSLSNKDQPEPTGLGQSKIRKDLLSADHHRNTGHAPAKKMPIWQLVAMDKSPKSIQEKKKKKENLEPENIVSNNKKSMLKVKHELHKDLEGELQKIDREKLAIFKLKYGEFQNMSPLFEEHVARLQSCTCNTGRSSHRNMDITDVPPSRWFEDLEDKTHSIIGYCDDEINKMLHEIGRYSTIDSKTIPSAKAKLCLLLISLPAYELFTIPVQKALKFVLEVIFQGEDYLLGEWFQHRKIPYIIQDAANT